MFHFWVINSKLKNKKLNFQLLTWSWKIFNFSSCYQLDGWTHIFFPFWVTNWRLKNKIHVKLLIRGVHLLYSQFWVINGKLITEKNYLNITVLMSVNSEKLILLPRFLRISYNSMSWGCPGMLKNGSGMDVVSNRWESIKSLFRGYILLGPRDIWIHKFWNMTFSYL